MSETLVESFRLSPQQRHLCALSHAEKGPFPYRTHTTALLEGALDLPGLYGALRQLEENYEILRTSFPRLTGFALPTQVINQDIRVPLAVYDCSLLSAQEQEGALATLRTAFAERNGLPYDMTKEAAWQVILIRCSARQHWLWWDMPALNADTQTCALLLKTLSLHYSRLRSNDGEQDEPLQYADLAEWLYEVLESGEASTGGAYWRASKYAQESSAALPYEQTVIAPAPFSPHAVTLELAPEIFIQLQDLAQQMDVSESSLLLACWGAILARLTARTDLLIGTGYDGRKYQELAQAVGLFAKLLPLSYHLPEKASYSEIVQHVEERMRQGYKWQEYFSWQFIETATEGIEPFCPFGFTYEATPVPWQERGVTWTVEAQNMYQDRFKVRLSCQKSAKKLHVTLHYDQCLFTRQDMLRLLTQWRMLCAQVLASPHMRLETIQLLTEQERHLIVSEWNATQANYPLEKGIHQLFEAQARHTPLAPALRCGELLLSYEQLDQQANQLAHLLLAQGLRPGQRVALCLPRSHWAIIALFAVLKAGGVYVPLEADLPPTRLQALLHELAPAFILCSHPLYDLLSTLPVPVLCVEKLPSQLLPLPLTAPEVPILPHALAYVIFTSGSTGTPKGVMISQQSVTNYTLALCERLAIEPGWHIATVSSLAADLGNTSIFCALASGGCLHVLPYELVADAAAFAAYVHTYPLDLLKIVPSHLHALLAATSAPILPRRRLILGGEPLPWSLLERIQQARPTCQLYNHYGPTEATIGALVAALGPVDRLELPPAFHRSGSVPLGRPLPNMQVYLLDALLQLVPPGVIGEIYLGGVGIAQGYLDRPDLTAERFLPDPFSQQPGSRLYRSGDLGRTRSDGTIEFLGRQDRQVKIRGYRIEPGEIEEQLRAHPDVREAAVDARAGVLVAYVVPRQPARPARQSLREALQEHLPDYMLPTHFVTLPALPLTSNGKIDYRQLPAPDPGASHSQEQEEEPAQLNPVEELVLHCWKQALQLERLGIHDNFFEMGGHSLLATQVVAQLQHQLEIEVPLLTLFEAPTVARLAARLSEDLLAEEQLSPLPIEPMLRTQELPLSFAQQRLWFLDQLEPGGTAYNVPRAVRLRGRLDTLALEKALQEVIMRHEILRTIFPSQQGVPTQRISPTSLSQLIHIDLRGLGSEEAERAARLLTQQEVVQPFNLVTGPLLRSYLLTLEEQNRVLVFTMHHIITDGWSMNILVRELTRCYLDAVQRRSPALPRLPVQYADYALWQHAWLQGSVLQRQLDYWKEQLADLEPLALPTDHPRPPVQTFRGAHQHLLLPATTSQQVQALARREGVTVFMTLLAAFQVLLARYSGQHDIAVGTPIANRTRQEVAGLIGFFVNTLVLRSDLSGDPSFLDLLARVRKVCLGAYAHQDLPFEQVVEALQPRRDRSRSPLFQVLFALPNVPQQAADIPLVQMENVPFDLPIAKFDLHMGVAANEHGLSTALEYNTDLFEDETIERLLSHWQNILQAVLQNPELPLSRLSLLSQQEQAQQLFHWNQTQQSLPDQGVHQLFEAQVARTPDAIAITGEEEQLSYAALNRQANRLAHHLQQLGVQPEFLVGVLLPRTSSLVVALLGILKAGGAYLPLDPTYPVERLQMMIEDAGLKLLLTLQSLQEQFPTLSVDMHCLDRDWQSINRQKSDNPISEIMKNSLAYVIYTSGSTGKPKGAMITQGGLLNYVQWSRQAYEVARGGPSLMHSSISFDLTVTGLFPALVSGSGVRLLETERDIVALARLVEHNKQISVLKITPSGLGALNQLLKGDELAGHVRFLVVGGEALPMDLVAQWQKHAPDTRIVNEYGPTETVVGSCVYEVEKAQAIADTVPIGRPIANTQLYILDAQLQPVPTGVEGELYIGGQGVARGYWGRAAQTAEKFIPHPFSQQGGERLYRTGDRARYQQDGTLEYLGRRDEQVKLRGYRIELGEIEAVLCEHDQVEQSVVVLQGQKTEERQLIAYVVSKQGQRQGYQGELRTYLKSKLPEYMLPARFVLLEALPLTPNGKVDRRNLPIPYTQGNELPVQEEGQGLLDPLKELVVQIFQEVLGLEQIGLEESFFEIGGHSLRAIQVLSRLNRRFGLKLPPGIIFEAPTVIKLAARLQQELQQNMGLDIPAIVPVPRSQQMPLSFAQQRLWFLHRLNPDNAAYTIPIAVHMQGQLHVAALQQSFLALVQRHESLRTAIAEKDGQPIQCIATSVDFPLLYIDLSNTTKTQCEEAVQSLIEQEARKPFDLAIAPLCRVLLLKRDHQDFILVLTMHHIVSDGWSMSVLVRELTTLYQAFLAGEPSPLAPLPIQYADYAFWQRQWLQGEVLREQVRYWTHQLSNAHALELPTDYARPNEMSNRGNRYNFHLSPRLSLALEQLSRQEGVTLFMTLLAAFQVLLYRLSGEQDVVVGTDSANRSHLETEGLIGFFINMLALRTNLSGNPKFINVLRAVRAMVLEAYMHQELPFELIVEHLRLPRENKRTPLVNVLFVMQNVPTTQAGLSQLQIQPFKNKSIFAKFDLALFMSESSQGLHGSINYSTDLFKPETIAMLAQRYEVLLSAIATQPDGPITGLEIATPAEKAQKTEKQATLRHNLKSYRGERLQLSETDNV